jgi:LysR family glycine cleavage system transcriptional activator
MRRRIPGLLKLNILSNNKEKPYQVRMSHISHLRSLQAIELALRQGSLKAAAESLSLTPAAVGQRIKMLEDYLGVDLLTRTRSGLGPTPALAPALPHLEAAFRELAAASEALDFQRINEIQIAAPSDWVELWLAPRLEAFSRRHPNIRFCINGEGSARLRVGQTDMEVSFAAMPAEADETRLSLFADFLAPVASPENAARIARAGGDHPLEGFPLLHLDVYSADPVVPDWTGWIGRHGQRLSPPGYGMRFHRIVPGLAAVQSRAGVMICGLAMIGGRLKAGELVLPFPLSTGVWTSYTFQARFRRDALIRPQVRRFRDWLSEEAAHTRSELADLMSQAGRRRRVKR